MYTSWLAPIPGCAAVKDDPGLENPGPSYWNNSIGSNVTVSICCSALPPSVVTTRLTKGPKLDELRARPGKSLTCAIATLFVSLSPCLPLASRKLTSNAPKMALQGSVPKLPPGYSPVSRTTCSSVRNNVMSVVASTYNLGPHHCRFGYGRKRFHFRSRIDVAAKIRRTSARK